VGYGSNILDNGSAFVNKISDPELCNNKKLMEHLQCGTIVELPSTV